MPTPSFNRVAVALASSYIAASIWVFTEIWHVILPQDKKITEFWTEHARADFFTALCESNFCLEGVGLHRALISLCS